MDQNLTCVLHGTADGWPNAVCGELAFSWLAEGCAGWQQAYRLCVMENGRPVWDTGWTESRCSASVEYTGPMLCWNRDYTAQVCLRTLLGQELTSAPLHFSTALDPSADWDADWLCSGFVLPGTTAPMFRKQFRLDALPARAKLFFCGLGYHEVYLNGRKVGDQRLSPAWTDYRRRVNYVVYDLLPYLRSGENVIGVMLGAGWYSNEESKPRPCFTAQLHLTMPDGTQQIRRTRVQDGWQCCKTPFLTQASIYIGERMDARLEEPGWTEPDFVSRLEWGPALESEPPEGRLVPMRVEPIRVVSCLAPCSVRQLPSGAAVADFGQNLAGVVQLRMHGLTPGTCVTLRFSEVITPDGELNTENLRTAQQCDVYLARGGEETYCPRFTYHGFRYAEISGLPDPLAAEDVCALVLRSDVASRGSFDSGEPLINDIQRICRWTESNNLHSVPTDCPQRDERLGWTGDAQVFIRTACLNFDAERFFTKWLADLAADQREDGAVGHVIPNVLHQSGSAAWDDAATICPWAVYLAYGDPNILRAQFASMKKWVDYITAHTTTKDLWTGGEHYGDWLGLDAPSGSYKGSSREELIASAFYAHSTALVIKAGRVLGQDISAYEALYKRIVRAFRQAYPVYQTQTECTLAVYFALAEDTQKAADQLAQMIRSCGTKLQTGFVGTPYLLHALSAHGYTELAYDLLLRREYPSWLYPVTKGATTIWEHWDGQMENGDFWSSNMNSFNHYAYGAVADWVYTVAAGIQTVEEKPGYAAVRIAPQPDKRLDWLEASVETRHGLVRSRWEKQRDMWRYEIETPVEAEVVIDGRKTLCRPGRYIFFSELA